MRTCAPTPPLVLGCHNAGALTGICQRRIKRTESRGCRSPVKGQGSANSVSCFPRSPEGCWILVIPVIQVIPVMSLLTVVAHVHWTRERGQPTCPECTSQGASE